MPGLGRRGEMLLDCPFCEKTQVRVFHKEGYLQGKQSRISAGGKFTFYSVPDFYAVLEDCPNKACRKTRKEIQDFLNGKVEKKTDPAKLKERITKAGLPKEIEFKV